MRIALRPPSGSALWACWATREGPRARPGRPRSPTALIRALSRRLHDVRACTASPPRSSRSSLPPPPHVPSAGRSWRRRRPALAPPSPRASRRRSRDTRLRLAAPSLRRSAPFEVAIGRASAAVAPPALSAYRALGGGGAGRRWRSHRHEPRGGGRSAPGGGSRRRLYGVWRRLTSPAAAPLVCHRRSPGSDRVSGVGGRRRRAALAFPSPRAARRRSLRSRRRLSAPRLWRAAQFALTGG